MTGRQGRGQPSVSEPVDQTKRQADEAFDRAHQVAVAIGLAEKGQIYQDYLDHQG